MVQTLTHQGQDNMHPMNVHHNHFPHRHPFLPPTMSNTSRVWPPLPHNSRSSLNMHPNLHNRLHHHQQQQQHRHQMEHHAAQLQRQQQMDHHRFSKGVGSSFVPAYTPSSLVIEPVNQSDSINEQMTIYHDENSRTNKLDHPIFNNEKVDPKPRPLQQLDANLATNLFVSPKPKKDIDAKKTTTPAIVRRGSSHPMKSPITLCFERMLGAAAIVDQTIKIEPLEPIQSDSEDSDPSEKPAQPTLLTIPKKVHISNKRKATYKQLLSKLKPGNPFLDILQNEELHQQIILNMALQREPCNKETPTEPVSRIIREGFYWRDYPELEELLYDRMEEFYQISILNRQSKFQQTFNNSLVERIREIAKNNDWEFEEVFTIKKLRDRVRCFFKTHLQNAKKRLTTLLKHPESVSHQALVKQFWPSNYNK